MRNRNAVKSTSRTLFGVQNKYDESVFWYLDWMCQMYPVFSWLPVWESLIQEKGPQIAGLDPNLACSINTLGCEKCKSNGMAIYL